MSSSPTQKLGELVEVRHGYAFKSENFVDEGPFILLTPGNFDDRGGFKFRDKQKFYDGPVPNEFVLTPGDLLVAMTEQGEGLLGSAAFVPGGKPCLHNQRLGRVLPRDSAKVDLRFVYYIFNSRPVRAQIRGSASGAKIRHTAPGRIYAVDVPRFPVAEQRRIASILGAYDDLIEVNRRRIAVLEAMARGLFEEWFVRFRFPGHEDLEIVETPEGPLPRGWRIGPVSTIIQFDPRTKIPATGEKPFIDMGSLDTSTSIISDFAWRSGNSGAKFMNGDTLFARITPCLQNGKTGLVRNLPSEDGVGFGSTEFIVMRPGRAGSAFAYSLARYGGFRSHAEGSMAGASGRQRARTESVAAYQMAIPDQHDDIYERFERVAWPMLELVGELGVTNSHLAASRDLLLPRLISGELSVAAAERELENAA